MNETNVVEAAVETEQENEQKVTKETEEETAEEVRAEDGGERVNIEEALPDSLKQSRERATRREHPAGEAFFRGSAEEVADAEAEEMARKQLERSGLLRGQRVRVAD